MKIKCTNCNSQSSIFWPTLLFCELGYCLHWIIYFMFNNQIHWLMDCCISGLRFMCFVHDHSCWVCQCYNHYTSCFALIVTMLYIHGRSMDLLSCIIYKMIYLPPPNSTDFYGNSTGKLVLFFKWVCVCIWVILAKCGSIDTYCSGL